MKTTLQLIGQLREVATFLKRGGDSLQVEIMFDAANRLEAAEALRLTADRTLAFLADLNGSAWIKGDDCGSVDMRQRARALQQFMFKALDSTGERL